MLHRVSTQSLKPCGSHVDVLIQRWLCSLTIISTLMDKQNCCASASNSDVLCHFVVTVVENGVVVGGGSVLIVLCPIDYTL